MAYLTFLFFSFSSSSSSLSRSVFLLLGFSHLLFFVIHTSGESIEPTVTEPTLITVHRCQVCNKDLPLTNTTICSDCQEQRESIHLAMQKNSSLVSSSDFPLC